MWLPLLIAAASATPVAPAREPAHPVTYSQDLAAQVIHRIYADRERAEAWFRQDGESYLAAIGRQPFRDKSSLTLGRAADNDVRIDDPAIAPHHLKITLLGDTFRIEALDDSARFRVGESELRDTTAGPISIAIGQIGTLWGRYMVRVSHQNDPALIVFDALNPRMQGGNRGLKHYPADLNYRFVLPITFHPHPDTVRIASTQGRNRRALRMGWVDFLVGETPCRLMVTRMLEPGIPPDNLEVFFKDATNGSETCALGRYVDLPKLGASGRYLLDFNTAGNPACAFSEMFNCPVPPRENTLKVPIPVGEKDLHYLSAK